MVELLRGSFIPAAFGAEFSDSLMNPGIYAFVCTWFVTPSSTVYRKLPERVVEKTPSVVMLTKQIQQFAPEGLHGSGWRPVSDPLGPEGDAQSRTYTKNFYNVAIVFHLVPNGQVFSLNVAP